ncbi:hypothetical protein GCM10028806_11760 [Spirosoma terrae]
MPAQFFNFSSAAKPVSGANTGALINTEDSFKKVLFFMVTGFPLNESNALILHYIRTQINGLRNKKAVNAYNY